MWGSFGSRARESLASRAASFLRAPARSRRDRRARVPTATRLAERPAASNGPADGAPRRTPRVLGLRARQFAADPALSEGLARALCGPRPPGDRRPLARLLVRARPGAGEARSGAPGDRLPRG